MPIIRDKDELRALAELMLLDLNIVDVKTPTVSRHALFQPAALSVDHEGCNTITLSNRRQD